MPGVRARRCTIAGAPAGADPTADPTTSVVDAGDVRITLTVAISSGVRVPATMDLLRERVATVVQAQTSITMQQIDIIVEDLYDL